MRVGYGDGSFESAEAATRELWLSNAVAAGGSLARINVEWSSIAPVHPGADFVDSDPASQGYRWDALDAAVRSASVHGLPVMFTVLNAPAWAEGPEAPSDARSGTWKPQPTRFASFGKALAQRYSGSYPDPLVPGSSLPRVGFYEVWNEPNQDYYLSPQWEDGHLVGPGIYRELVNAFYGAVKSVQPGAKILAGSMSPFGDPPGGTRTPPVIFLRSMLCLQGGRLKPVHCSRPAHLDILSDHPITAGPPQESARSPLDVCTPDLGRLTRILDRAEQTQRVLPAGRKPLWATEYWYDSNPPDPNGLPLGKQARWYEQALYEIWRGGASALIIQPLRDTPPIPEFANSLQSGLYFIDGQPKPSLQAMRFPFVSQRVGRRTVQIWGIAPHKGSVRVQTLRGGHWLTLTSLHANGLIHPFMILLDLRHAAILRATIGTERSLVWKQG